MNIFTKDAETEKVTMMIFFFLTTNGQIFFLVRPRRSSTKNHFAKKSFFFLIGCCVCCEIGDLADVRFGKTVLFSTKDIFSPCGVLQVKTSEQPSKTLSIGLLVRLYQLWLWWLSYSSQLELTMGLHLSVVNGVTGPG